jgi:uncharacterized protein YjaG (DUF416 family)
MKQKGKCTGFDLSWTIYRQYNSLREADLPKITEPENESEMRISNSGKIN